MAEHIDKAAVALQLGLYGPRFCKHCNAVQPVMTYKLEGSDFSEANGTKITMGFTGAHVCSVCYRTIEPEAK